MSLINDALKRAKQSQNESPPPPLQFHGTEKKRERRALSIFVGAALASIFAGSVALLVVFLLMRQESRLGVGARNAPPLPAQTQQFLPVTPPTAATTIVTPDTLTIVSPSSQGTTELPVPAPTFPGENDTNSLPVVAAVEPPKSAGPKLQGIFFNPGRPSAIVNGRTVYVGNTVGNARVTRITLESVTLVSNSATNVLRLSE